MVYWKKFLVQVLGTYLGQALPEADLFVKRNGIGVLRLPFNSKERNQYMKRLEKRKELVR